MMQCRATLGPRALWPCRGKKVRPEAERGEQAVVASQLPVGRTLDQDGAQERESSG